MDEHVHVKKEPKWCGEEREAPSPGDDNEARVYVAGRGEFRGIDQISQSSYSAAVNLAHGATKVKEEQQVAATDVDFDSVIPQFVCAPDVDPLRDPPAASGLGAPPPEFHCIKREFPTPESTEMEAGDSSHADHGTLPPRETGRFVFCPVVGAPYDEEHRGREPCDGADKTAGDETSRAPTRPRAKRATGEHTCKACGTKLQSRLALKQHVRLQCSVGERQPSSPNKHVASNGSEDTTSIQIEALSTSERARVEAKPHVCEASEGARVHAKPHVCDTCGARFTHVSSLKEHRRMHTGDNPFACDMCEARFTKRSSMTTHRRTHTGERPYACDRCDARFSQVGGLANHKRTHTGERAYVCDKCDARFMYVGGLNKHKRNLHGRATSPACAVCSETFPDRFAMIAHAGTHAGKKTFACDRCDATFSRVCSLTYHRHLHTRVLTVSCEECGKRFATDSALASHKRQHAPVKPFACQTCSARFATNGSLTKHKTIHTRERPFGCQVCNDKFATDFALNRHSVIHSGPRPFVCEVCEARFSHRDYLESHKLEHTGEKS